MKLNEIFLKDVTRSIEGVVKADDTDHLAVEVEEYVFTNDAAKGVAPLLEEYTNYTNANGVWISGFFGSGKSHLLKMLAHLFGDEGLSICYCCDCSPEPVARLRR